MFVAAFVFLVAMIVPTLRQLRQTAAALEAVARKVDMELQPTIHEAQGLVRDVATLTRRVDGDLKVVSRIVEDVSDTTAYAKQIAGTMKAEAERPLVGIVSALAGFRRAADAYRVYREKSEAPRNPFRKAARKD